LWAKTSAAGDTYFVGRWGGVKVLILENRDRQSDREPSHHLFVCEAVEKPPQGAQDARSAAADTGAQPRQPRRSVSYETPAPMRPDSVPIANDRIDDLWPPS
jgi:hypothetical protein